VTVRDGEVATEIAPFFAATSQQAASGERLDALLERTCALARALTGAEQAALKLWVDDPSHVRKYFSLSAKYAAYREYREDPSGLGLHGIEIPPGDVVRMTQPEVEVHPEWRAFGDQAGKHPPMRGWLATAVCSEDGRRYGMLQLSDKQGGADFTEQDEFWIRELAALTGGTLDALRASAESSADLIASRARVVAAADEARRRIQRDLHDGAQQRLVSIGLALRAAEANVPPEVAEVRAELSRAASELAAAVEDLQEISRGIHPAVLSRGGLAPALKALARRAAVPVQLETRIDRMLQESVAVAAYYVVSETLTNAAKHAHASVVDVDVATVDRMLCLSLRDDGAGGADPRRGSGLVGLRDRVEALGGAISVQSPLGEGTSLHVELPLDD
jgi:signal transduction histidine kinase